MKDCIMLSIDSSTKKTGIAIWKNGLFSDYLLIDCEGYKTMDERFKNMAERLIEILNRKTPSIVYVEETVVVRNAQTQRFLTRLQGVIYGWCIQNACEFNTIRPTEWRKQLGFTQGKNIKRDQLKQQSIDYTKNKYNIEVGDDIADAICIGEAVLRLFENK